MGTGGVELEFLAAEGEIGSDQGGQPGAALPARETGGIELEIDHVAADAAMVGQLGGGAA